MPLMVYNKKMLCICFIYFMCFYLYNMLRQSNIFFGYYLPLFPDVCILFSFASFFDITCYFNVRMDEKKSRRKKIKEKKKEKECVCKDEMYVFDILL